MPTTIINLGQGELTWPSAERVSDRYGAVCFSYPGWMDLPLAEKADGQRGTLKAKVLESRVSGHIGDLFRGVYPTQPAVGEVVILGTGTFRVAPNQWGGHVLMCEPDEPRDQDWYNIHSLYRCHEQTVELWLEVAR